MKSSGMVDNKEELQENSQDQGESELKKKKRKRNRRLRYPRSGLVSYDPYVEWCDDE